MKTFVALSQIEFKDVPCNPGVYFVHVPKGFKKKFINPGAGGYFHGKDPNVSLETLENKWIKGAEVLYIGKTRMKGGLRERIKLYTKFGEGRPVGHYGGRYIWQIKNAVEVLSVSWEEDANPEEREKREIGGFKDDHEGMLPFANLVTPRRK